MDVDKILEGLKERYATEKVTDIDGVTIDFAQGMVGIDGNRRLNRSSVFTRKLKTRLLPINWQRK